MSSTTPPRPPQTGPATPRLIPRHRNRPISSGTWNSREYDSAARVRLSVDTVTSPEGEPFLAVRTTRAAVLLIPATAAHALADGLVDAAEAATA